MESAVATIIIKLPISISIDMKSLYIIEKSLLIRFVFIADDIRDLNGHADDEIKRQRLHYGSDQLYSVSHLFRLLTTSLCFHGVLMVNDPIWCVADVAN